MAWLVLIIKSNRDLPFSLFSDLPQSVCFALVSQPVIRIGFPHCGDGRQILGFLLWNYIQVLFAKIHVIGLSHSVSLVLWNKL